MQCLSYSGFLAAPPDGRSSAPPQVLSEREAARVLSVGMRTLQRWRLGGGGPIFVKLSGTRVGYLRADLEAEGKRGGFV